MRLLAVLVSCLAVGSASPFGPPAKTTVKSTTTSTTAKVTSTSTSIKTSTSTSVKSTSSSTAATSTSTSAKPTSTVVTSTTSTGSTSSSITTLTSSTALASTSSTATIPSSTSTQISSTTSTTSPTAVPTGTFEVDQRALILGCGDGSEESPAFTLKSYSIPYDVVIAAISNLTNPQPLNLEYAVGQGRYSMIILPNAQMLMQNGTGGPYISTLTPTQWSQLRTYQANYGVRLVALNDQPDGVYVSRYGGFWGVSDSNNIIVSPVTGVPYTSAAGLTSTWSLPATGLYHTPGTILNAAAATEVLQFGVFAPDYPVLTSAAVVLSYGNRTQMSFYFPCGSWSTTCLTISHIWVQWGTRGLYNGFRRIYFVPQIDDIFLTTDGLDENGKAVGFRVSPADINGIISWQSDINARMPKGSDFRLEFAYNGNGILEMSADHTDYFLDIDVDLTDTPLDWVKPPGTGYNLWPQPISKLDQNWDANTLMQYDPLLAHLRTPAIRDQFYWCSHTFTHEILNNNSYADTIDEVTFNYKMGGPSYANVIGQPNWSNISMVTPGISGLFNADALRALWDFGIIAAVGDSSRPKTYDANMPYWWPLITTVANNGFDGFTIVPRQVLNIYFNVTNPNYLVTLYNQIYPTAHADFAYIMNAEVERVSRILMALSWNPYMFHQANLRNADMPLVPIPGTTRTARLGLCQQWVETILAWYGAHVTWPLVTIKLDDLTRAYWARKTSDTAGVRVWYKGTSVAGGGVQVGGLFVTAAVSCTAPVTLPLSVAASNVVVPAGGRIEQIGDDPVTVWVPLIGGAAPVQVSFHTAFVY